MKMGIAEIARTRYVHGGRYNVPKLFFPLQTYFINQTRVP